MSDLGRATGVCSCSGAVVRVVEFPGGKDVPLPKLQTAGLYGVNKLEFSADGKKVLGGGAALSTNTANAPVAIQDSYPMEDGSGWFAAASRTGTFSPGWALKTWAVCGTVS